MLDISSVSGGASLSVDIVWNGQDGPDYIDVEYQIDGGSWIQVPNQFGGGSHTIDYNPGPNTGMGTITESGLTGNTLSVRVCVDTNTSVELTRIDNLSVPEATVISLPVELIFFDAQKRAEEVLLKWSTATEINNEKFEIEHSKDGSQFEKIGEVKGTGTTELISNYSFHHERPLVGANYYRLKQIDFDGKFEYSDVVGVDVKIKKEEIGSFYPNPSKTGLVFLAYHAIENSNTEIFVYDLSGKYILGQQVEIIKGRNNLNFDFNALKEGIYFVELKNKTTSIFRKLVIN